LRNVLSEYGYGEQLISQKIDNAWRHIFENDATRFYYEHNDAGYMTDTGNNDARTEGMSYGMMMAVQMNRKDIFDRLWLWSKRYMQHADGLMAGYFAWSCMTDGTRNAEGPAPDGEEYYAMALLFASALWGDGEPPYDYSTQAKDIIRAMIHNAKPMFHPENKQILFVPGAPFSDPSYHLPHFYKRIADGCYPEDKAFMLEAEAASRAYLKTACHPETGLAPDYGNFDGSPVRHERRLIGSAHYSDSYRVALNVALDVLWAGAADAWQQSEAERLQHFFLSRPDAMTDTVVNPDGSPFPKEIMHPLGLLSTAAAISTARPVNEESGELIRRFIEAPMRTDGRRYYDNCLYFFSLLTLAGRYRVIGG
jgi:oligosaccharide reducing-end xylanase